MPKDHKMDSPDDMTIRQLLGRFAELLSQEKAAIDRSRRDVAGDIFARLYVEEVKRLAGTKTRVPIEELVQQALTAADALADGLVESKAL
jgi:hypothetical protein